MTNKAFILRVLSNAKGDDSHRARSAFRNCTPEQMAEKYGQSDQTRQEILDGYLEQDAKFDAAIAWLASVREE